MSNRKKRRLVFLVILLVIVGGLYGAWKYYLSLMHYQDAREVSVNMDALETDEQVTEAATEQITEHIPTAEEIYDRSSVTMADDETIGDTFTLLVIGGGSPEAEAEGKREDAQAVILMSINYRKGACIFHTLHGDMYVDIPDENGGIMSGHRLANAYAVGGGPLLAQTIETNFGIRINNYATISLGDVARIIEMPEFEKLDISNQGIDVVEEMLYQLGDQNPVQVAAYIAKVLPYVTHNFTGEQMRRLILQIPKVVVFFSEKYTMPQEIGYQKLDGYLVTDAGSISEVMKTYIYG